MRTASRTLSHAYKGAKPPNAWCGAVNPLPGDMAVGTTTVTFSGVVVGSEIHVYLPDGDGGSAGTEVAGVESCSANQVLSWPVYAPGSPNNTVFITIIKRGVGWLKFPFQSVVGSQLLPIFQRPDLGYSNPA